MVKTGKALKVWAWIFIILSIIIPLSVIGSIICSVKYKKYDEAKGAKLLQFSIVVAGLIFIINLLRLLGWM